MTFPIGRLSSRIASIPRINTTAAITMSPLKWIPRARYAYIAKTSVLASQRPCYSTTGLNSDHGSSPEANSDHPIHTVNKEEIAKFAAMSDEWWAPQGPFKMLHLFNPPRVRYIRNRLEASGAISNAMTNDSTDKGKAFSSARFPLQGLSIVDIGCGGGLLSEALARLGAQVTGLDASMENIQMARLHSKKDPLLNGGGPGTLEYRHQTAEQLLAEGRQFDVVCSLEVIEHVDNPAGFLKVLGELVKVLDIL
ncbi:Hexaprenyldihydroxybenzoate methyltransferase, mitochondrial [Gamsiella multidivaricata]|nr:Hexaprenyldihydroxybenzoate methyltransferase, mitochondrial [Gamsiella multidivaricata]